MTLAYPRLQRAPAAELLDELTGMSPEDRRARSATFHSRADWYPTAPARVDEERLRALQALIRETAAEFGHPAVSGRSPRFTEFDRSLASQLLTHMDISPAEAAHEGVWSFLSLVLVPDVALWRFPNRDLRNDYERIIGRPRNILRRLWWRAYILGDACGELREDEAVAILERPTLGFDRRIAGTLAAIHLATVRTYPSVGRTELLRDVTKRLRRLSVPVTLTALGDGDLEATIREQFDRSLAAFSGPG
jgi:hypothetical protein